MVLNEIIYNYGYNLVVVISTLQNMPSWLFMDFYVT